MGGFINLSNHPSAGWSEAQLAAARKFGKVLDMSFPKIDPSWTPEQIDRAAETYAKLIHAMGKPVVMVQGEFTFTYNLVRRLQADGVRAVVSCSQRVSEEYVDEKGDTVKLTTFRFAGFRDYYRLGKSA